MSDFNKILHQQRGVELQTNCKISVKSVNNCKSYSGFSAGTQKLKRPLYAMTLALTLLNCVAEEISNNRPA